MFHAFAQTFPYGKFVQILGYMLVSWISNMQTKFYFRWSKASDFVWGPILTINI